MAFSSTDSAPIGTALSAILKPVRTTGARRNFRGIFRKNAVTPRCRKEHLASPPSLVTTPREVIAPQAVEDVVVLEALRPRIEPGYTLLAADPQPAAGIFENTHEIVARQPIRIRVARDDFILRVESI